MVNVYKPGYSDHDAVQVSLNSCNTEISARTNYITKRSFSKENMEYFNYLLRHKTWKEVYESQDMESKFNNFLITFMHFFQHCLPIS